MIKLQNVWKQYDNITAVEDVSFEVPEGKLCVIIGPSGCGKSTTLRLVNRMIEPDKGKIFVNSTNILNQDPVQLRRTIGYVIQNIGLFPHLNVEENISVVPKLLGWPKEKRLARAEELLDFIGLDSKIYAKKRVSQLSGGEAQRIGVARGLAADPPILLMDEPFGAVDPLNREVLQDDFLSIQKELKKTVLFVTHDLDEAIRLADIIILMKDGKLIQAASPDKLLSSPGNRFVRDFVGSDRALKRLVRITAAEVMEKPDYCVLKNGAFTCEEKTRARYLWVTDENKKVLGWIDQKYIDNSIPLEEQYTQAEPDTISVRNDGSLREVLSRMMGQGVRSVPIVNKDRELIGQIGLEGLEDYLNAGETE
ncbi:MAG: betaine/proline/choline family ABC transporter ATP-binding protein [Spirochaetia bacterium]